MATYLDLSSAITCGGTDNYRANMAQVTVRDGDTSTTMIQVTIATEPPLDGNRAERRAKRFGRIPKHW